MRTRAYRLFEIVAWPALVWCALEVALRVATGQLAGIAPTMLTGICAGLTVVAARARSRDIALPQAVRIRD